MLLLFFCVVAAWAQAAWAQAAVVELSDSDFISLLLSSEHTLIYFYRDQCRFCSEFDGDFEYLSLIFNDEKRPEFQIVKINGAKNARANALFKVDRYPTLKMYHNASTEIVTFQQERLFEGIVDFIEFQVPGVEPDYSRFRSRVRKLSGNVDKSSLGETLVVFMLENMHGWDDFGRPNHFLERLAATNEFSNTHFAVVDIFGGETDLQREFSVSNFPSAIYFDTKGRFKVLDTYTTNPDTQFGDEQVRDFLKSVHLNNGWFENSTQLAEFIAENEYTGHKYHRPGFNVIQDRTKPHASDQDDDLLEHIEL